MADKTIGDLTRATRLLTADLIPIEQGGNAKSISGDILAQFAREKGAEAAGEIESYMAKAQQWAEKAEGWSAHPPYIGSNGNWWIYSTTAKQFVDSGIDAIPTVKIQDITMLAEGAKPYVTSTGTDTDPVFHLFIPIGARGATGATGNGIADVKLNPDYTLTVTYTNGESVKTSSIRGATGKGIESVTLNSDYTLTILFTDGTKTSTASIRGAKGEQGDKGERGIQGYRGEKGNGITGIAKTKTVGLVDTYTITFDDGTSETFTVTNGGRGETGNGIVDISKTKTAGLVDTYTITFHDGATTTFTVANGAKGDQGEKGDKGDKGETGVSIAGVTKTGTRGLVDTYQIGFDDGSSNTFTVTNGEKGDTGNGIVDISKTGRSGLNDIYTITFDDGTETTFTVTNGAKGDIGDKGEKGDKGDEGERGPTGTGITGISKTGTVELVDTYTITFDDGRETTFTVVNGKKGDKGDTGNDGISTAVKITNIPGGTRLNITDKDHPEGQDIDILNGDGSGDMVSSTYDKDGNIAKAGGIEQYVADTVGTRATMINETSDDEHYPSAKAVYELFHSIVNANDKAY